ncbi:hypothetical protein SRHO_G00205090 [Serrasalmus rhombeus]
MPIRASSTSQENALSTSVGRGSAESRGTAALLREHEDGRSKDQRVTGGGALMTLWNGGGFLSYHTVLPLSPSVKPTQGFFHAGDTPRETVL